MIINYGRQSIDRKDIDSVKNALKQDLITTGKFVKKFEVSLSKYLNSKHVVSCNSGTSAILMSIMALNLRKNANVIIPAINFVAAANMCNLLGYKVFFSDINPETGQISSKEILECSKKNNIKKIDLIFSMHLGGYPAHVIDLFKLKRKLKCYIIEDACHALGSSYKYKKKLHKVGNGRHADISTFSFHPLKTITTGEGGAVSTNSKYFANRVQLIRSHGIINKKEMNYDVKLIGYNFRLSDLNCALGFSQMKKIDKILSSRRSIFKNYLKKINNFKDTISIMNEEYRNSSCHLVIARINFSKLKINKSKFFNTLKKCGIICQFHYVPQYHFSSYKSKNLLKNTEDYYENCISLPIHLMINKKKLDHIITNIKKIISQNILLK
jgi:dTDP-4-amino-4,6-dideoxygalactose transaminase